MFITPRQALSTARFRRAGSLATADTCLITLETKDMGCAQFRLLRAVRNNNTYILRNLYSAKSRESESEALIARI